MKHEEIQKEFSKIGNLLGKSFSNIPDITELASYETNSLSDKWENMKEIKYDTPSDIRIEEIKELWEETNEELKKLNNPNKQILFEIFVNDKVYFVKNIKSTGISLQFYCQIDSQNFVLSLDPKEVKFAVSIVDLDEEKPLMGFPISSKGHNDAKTN